MHEIVNVWIVIDDQQAGVRRNYPIQGRENLLATKRLHQIVKHASR